MDKIPEMSVFEGIYGCRGKLEKIPAEAKSRNMMCLLLAMERVIIRVFEPADEITFGPPYDLRFIISTM